MEGLILMDLALATFLKFGKQSVALFEEMLQKNLMALLRISSFLLMKSYNTYEHMTSINPSILLMIKTYAWIMPNYVRLKLWQIILTMRLPLMPAKTMKIFTQLSIGHCPRTFLLTLAQTLYPQLELMVDLLVESFL